MIPEICPDYKTLCYFFFYFYIYLNMTRAGKMPRRYVIYLVQQPLANLILMKKRVYPFRRFSILIFILLFIPIMPASTQNLSDYLPKTISEWKATGPDKFYYPENLYEYINGGAELFISYGFNQVISRTYKRSGQPDILVEIFNMVEAKNAFGVYSQGREKIDSTYGQGSQIYHGAILFWKGPYYISIVTDSETTQSKPAIIKMAKKIDKAIKVQGTLPEILNWIPEEELAPESIFYFYHYIWLNALYYISDDNFLNINDKTDAVLAKFGPSDERYFLLLVRYENEKKSRNAYQNFLKQYAPELEGRSAVKLEDGKWTGCRVELNLLVCVFNATSEINVDLLLKKVFDKYLLIN